MGIIITLGFFGSMGFNYWLNYNLPRIVKEKSPYDISYSNLSVGLFSGDIDLSDVEIHSKSKEDSSIVEIEGKVTKMKILDFGIWNALFRNRITSKIVVMEAPDLKIILPQPAEQNNSSENKKNKPWFFFKHVQLSDGNISVFKHTEDILVAVEELNLDFKNLLLTEESIKKSLPVMFDDYSITGKNFLYKSDDIYEFKAHEITTENGIISIDGFSMLPLLSHPEFIEKYPEKTSLFDVDAQNLTFKNIHFEGNNLSLKEIVLTSPKIKLLKTNAQGKKSEESLSLNIILDNLKIHDGHFLLLRPDEKEEIRLEKLEAEISKLKMNEETEKGEIPFKYGDYRVRANSLQYHINRISSVAANNIEINSRDIHLENLKYFTGNPDNQNVVTVPELNLTGYEYTFEKGIPHLSAQNLSLKNMDGKINLGQMGNPENQKRDRKQKEHNEFRLDLKLKSLNINGNLILNTSGKKHPISIKDFNVAAEDLEMNQSTFTNIVPLKYADINLRTREVTFAPNNYSKLSLSSLSLTNKDLYINDFHYAPTKTRTQFLASLRLQEDLYTVKIPKIELKNYLFDQNGQGELTADRLNIKNMYLNVFAFTGENPPRDTRPRTFFNEKLRNIGLPFGVDEMHITDSQVEYEETNEVATAPGKLSFMQLNAVIRNLNSGKIKNRNTLISMDIKTKFMNSGDTKVQWNFDVGNRSDAFTFHANIDNLNAAAMNAFLTDYLHVSASGTIQNVNFNFKGDNRHIEGPFHMKFNDLNTAILRSDKTRKGFDSFLANTTIRKNSKEEGQNVDVEVDRAEKRSFFNQLWRGIESGLKKSILGRFLNWIQENI